MMSHEQRPEPVSGTCAAKHAELKLTPVGLAPPNLLLRRIYFDLTGLPPTDGDLESFLSVSPSLRLSVSAPSQDSERYEAVIDKLLA